MGALHNTARFLGLAERLRHTDKITLVLNRSNSGIGADDLQRTLGIPVACGVVSAGRMMLDAVNEGTTLFAMDPTRRERITQDLAAIVELVAGRAQPPVQREHQRPSLWLALAAEERMTVAVRTHPGLVGEIVHEDRPRDLQAVSLLLVDGSSVQRRAAPRARARARSTI